MPGLRYLRVEEVALPKLKMARLVKVALSISLRSSEPMVFCAEPSRTTRGSAR
jgi:hypothetical protein